MGSYLSEPVTEKISNDETNDKLKCGYSSMQGWRLSQEDAHNVLLDFDSNTSFFAVYDGHGGHEVAMYCSQKLPQFIKDTEAYIKGNIQEALLEGFLGFDATITTQKVIDYLKKIAKENECEEESEDENVDNLYEEALMPIEQVIEKYTSLANPSMRSLKKDKLHSKSEESCAGSSSSSSPSNSLPNDSKLLGISNDNIENTEGDKNNKSENESKDPQIQLELSGNKQSESSEKEDIPSTKSEANKETKNGQLQDSTSKGEVINSTPIENGGINAKGKGKAVIKPQEVISPAKTKPKRTAKQLYQCLLDFGGEESEEDTEDEEDKSFVGANETSSDEDEGGVNVSIEAEVSEDSSEGEEDDIEGEDEEAEAEEEDEEEEEEEDDDDDDMDMVRNMKEEPGSDSGCTAVVALLCNNELYVANAGDSRCVVCRKGKAIEMSFDHKPEDVPERERIVKAGGKVNRDGRVNGGLNLSRAIGDHAYKQNKDLSDREQMITAMPDVKTLTINPVEDEFMVLACDGIWNSMSSQDVVNFVRERMDMCGDKLSTICEEMFDHCLASNTMCDGSGCDNMTAIIVQFKSNTPKRSAPEESSELSSKRAKTDENHTDTETAA